VVVLVQQDGLVLLVKRVNDPQRGKWTLPGGFMDAGEDPQEAAVRECLEETGLEVRIVSFLDLEAHPEAEQGAHLVITYLAEPVAGSLTPGDDADQAGFFAPDHLPALAFQDAARLVSLVRGVS
jgi:8-oxo-dGTP diphosphatase